MEPIVPADIQITWRPHGYWVATVSFRLEDAPDLDGFVALEDLRIQVHRQVREFTWIRGFVSGPMGPWNDLVIDNRGEPLRLTAETALTMRDDELWKSISQAVREDRAVLKALRGE